MLAAIATSVLCLEWTGVQGSAQNPGQKTIPTPLVYRNTQYGFCFRLPASWKGYKLIWEKWSGSPINDTDGKPIEGPMLSIRNPKWTEDDPYQDIPIMIFTRAQWIASDDYVFSAAPNGPGDIGRNKRYVFAQPRRWIGYTDADGFEEVMSLMRQHPLEAPCRRVAIQSARH
jgi:hypothetical protein